MRTVTLVPQPLRRLATAQPRAVIALFCALILSSCFGSAPPIRSYYVLHGVTASSMVDRPIDGLVRVRNLDAATVYEKFQIVVRSNPYQLRYDEDNIWAVKPSQMVADVIARALNDSQRFTAVIRELGELRPKYILGGRLQAVEVYDSNSEWYAHLSLTLSLTEFATGRTLHSLSFDERRPLPERSYAQAARAISELLSTAIDELVVGLESVDAPRAERATAPPEMSKPKSDDDATDSNESKAAEDMGPEDPHDEDADLDDDSSRAEDGTIFVPERE